MKRIYHFGNFVRRRLEMILIVSLIAIPATMYLLITSHDKKDEYVSAFGLDLISDCQVEPELSYTIKLYENPDRIWVDAVILNYMEIREQCKYFEYIVPGIASNFTYQVFEVSDPEKTKPGWRPKYSKLSSVLRDPFGFQKVKIQEGELPGFWGIINFLWHTPQSRKSYGVYKMKVPFFSPTDGVTGTHGLTKKQTLKLYKTNALEVENFSHPIKNRQEFGRSTAYEFQIGTDNKVFEFSSMYKNKVQWGNWIINFCLIFLGAGIALALDRIIAVLRRSRTENAVK